MPNQDKIGLNFNHLTQELIKHFETFNTPEMAQAAALHFWMTSWSINGSEKQNLLRLFEDDGFEEIKKEISQMSEAG